IRDKLVTGVQTCALPILLARVHVDAIAIAAGAADGEVFRGDIFTTGGMDGPHAAVLGGEAFEAHIFAIDWFNNDRTPRHLASTQIGRASCRERGQTRVED